MCFFYLDTVFFLVFVLLFGVFYFLAFSSFSNIYVQIKKQLTIVFLCLSFRIQVNSKKVFLEAIVKLKLPLKVR